MSLLRHSLRPSPDPAYQIDQFAHHHRIQRRSSVIFSGRTPFSDAFSASIAGIASSISLPIAGRRALACRYPPARFFWDRHILSPVFVHVLDGFRVLFQQFRALLRKRPGNVFQKDETKDDMLVFRVPDSARLSATPETTRFGSPEFAPFPFFLLFSPVFDRPLSLFQSSVLVKAPLPLTHFLPSP